MAEEDTGSTELPITLDGGNGNEPPPKLAADVVDVEVVDAHPAHGWLDTLLSEFQNLDEVAKNRLHHIVEQIRAAL
jgi:hypothetical protein